VNDDNIAATEAMLERVSHPVWDAVDSGIESHLWEKVTQLMRLRLGSGAIKWVSAGYDPARLDKFLSDNRETMT
jgi:hypothetical protein